MRFASFGGLLALCLLFGNSCSKGVSRATSVTLFFVKGDVVFGSTERNQFQPVTSKNKIRGSDIVRTSEGASINLALLPGAFAGSSCRLAKPPRILGMIARDRTRDCCDRY